MAIEKCINEFDVGDVIFEEGSTGRELFVVLDGKIDIAKISGASKTVIVTLGKGEFFGEMAVIDGSSRSATAIAAAPNTRVMRINHARFVYLVSQQPAFALMIMDALSKRLRAANAYLVRGKSRTIMIDVGLSSNYPALLECLEHLGCPPDKIDMVILSHEH